jgi:hypothetical protein
MIACARRRSTGNQGYRMSPKTFVIPSEAAQRAA